MSNPDLAPAPGASQPEGAEPSSGRGRWGRLPIAVAVAALWLAMLAGLALFTANPITLNVDQIRTSDYVVTGRLLEDERNVIAVERKWKGDELPAELRVQNLAQAASRPGRSYLVPLSRTRSGTLEVTRTDLPENPPLVYPATDEAITQLAAILSEPSADQSSSASGSAADP